MTDLQEGVNTLLGWDIFGEASANYLLRCTFFEKVARGQRPSSNKSSVEIAPCQQDFLPAGHFRYAKDNNRLATEGAKTALL
jgi:hypothetical protein